MTHGQPVPSSPVYADPVFPALSRASNNCFMCGLSHWLADCAIAVAYIKARRIVRIGSQLAFPDFSRIRPHSITRLLQTTIDEKYGISLAPATSSPSARSASRSSIKPDYNVPSPACVSSPARPAVRPLVNLSHGVPSSPAASTCPPRLVHSYRSGRVSPSFTAFVRSRTTHPESTEAQPRPVLGHATSSRVARPSLPFVGSLSFAANPSSPHPSRASHESSKAQPRPNHSPSPSLATTRLVRTANACSSWRSNLSAPVDLPRPVQPAPVVAEQQPVDVCAPVPPARTSSHPLPAGSFSLFSAAPLMDAADPPVSERSPSPGPPGDLFLTKEGRHCMPCTKTTIQKSSNITASDAIKTILARLLEAPIPSTADPAKSKFAQVLDIVIPGITVRELLTISADFKTAFADHLRTYEAPLPSKMTRPTISVPPVCATSLTPFSAQQLSIRASHPSNNILAPRPTCKTA